jgi:hypothetical protein
MYFGILARLKQAVTFLPNHIQVGKSLDQVRAYTLILLPFTPNRLCCGICALVAFKGPSLHVKKKMTSRARSITWYP